MAIDQYLNLITSEHRLQPKFTRWLSAALNKVDDGRMMTNSVPQSFDVNTAVGTQLDLIGLCVGIERDVRVPLSSGSSILDDDHYRTMIRAKIARNSWDGTTNQIYDLWSLIFPGSGIRIVDNQDMTMDVRITGMTDVTSTELVKAGFVIPKPMGVLISQIDFNTILIWDDLTQNHIVFSTTDIYTWDQLELSSI